MEIDEKEKGSMILHGPIKRVLLKLAAPLIFSNIIATFYSLADGLWLARLSYTEFAATSFTWPLVFLFVSIAIGISIAGTALISRMIGAGRKDKASLYANNLIILSLILGTVFTVIGYTLAPTLIGIMGAKGDLYTHSLTYFQVSTLGIIVDTMYFSIQAILNAQGKTKSTTAMGLVSGILNITLDPLFIFSTVPFIGIAGLNMGVAGAAYATILAKIIALILGYIQVKKDTSNLEVSAKYMKIDATSIKTLVSMAIPTSIGRSSAALGFSVMNALIVSYGQEVVAGFSMVNRITDFWMQISMGVGAAMTTMIGQNLGAKNESRAKDSLKAAQQFALISSAIGIIFLVLFPSQLLSLFVDKVKDPNVYNIAKEYMIFAVVNIPFMALFNIYQSLFQGSGKMNYSMHMSTGRLWLIRVPLVLLLTHFTGIGRMSIWISMLASNVLIDLYAIYIQNKKDVLKI